MSDDGYIVTFTSMVIHADSEEEAIDRAGDFRGGGNWEAERVGGIISEDWLLENLPHGWTYDCRFEPEPAFLIYAGEGGAAPRYGPFVLPLRLLHNPDATKEMLTRLSDHGHEWEQRARRAEARLAKGREGETVDHDPSCRSEHLTAPDSEGIRDCTNCGLWEYPHG